MAFIEPRNADRGPVWPDLIKVRCIRGFELNGGSRRDVVDYIGERPGDCDGGGIARDTTYAAY